MISGDRTSWKRECCFFLFLIVIMSQCGVSVGGFISSQYNGEAQPCFTTIRKTNGCIHRFNSTCLFLEKRNFHQTRLLMTFPNENNDSNGDFDEAVTEKTIESSWIDILNEGTKSFRFIETRTSKLLSNNPIIALTIFVGVGLIVAYMTGAFFLKGYISSGNPYMNGAVPYWEDIYL